MLSRTEMIRITDILSSLSALTTCCCYCCLVAQSCLTLCDPMDCNMPGFPFLHCLLEFARPYVHWVNDAIQQSHPRLTPFPPAFNLPQHQDLFQWVSSSHQVAKVLELQLQHPYSNEYSGLISFRIDWFDLLAVQGTLKSLFQHFSSKALSLLYGPILTSVHDYWKNYRLNYTDNS